MLRWGLDSFRLSRPKWGHYVSHFRWVDLNYHHKWSILGSTSLHNLWWETKCYVFTWTLQLSCGFHFIWINTLLYVLPIHWRTLILCYGRGESTISYKRIGLYLELMKKKQKMLSCDRFGLGDTKVSTMFVPKFPHRLNYATNH